MPLREPLWRIALLLVIGLATANSLAGWRRMHGWLPGLASRRRLLYALLFSLAMIAGLVWPLPALAGNWVGHTLQFVTLGLFSGAFYWLACDFHIILWSLPGPLRRMMTRWLLRPSLLTPLLTLATAPGLVWTLALLTLLLWYTPQLIHWMQTNLLMRNLAPLWLMVVSRLFWWRMVGTGMKMTR